MEWWGLIFRNDVGMFGRSVMSFVFNYFWDLGLSILFIGELLIVNFEWGFKV